MKGKVIATATMIIAVLAGVTYAIGNGDEVDREINVLLITIDTLRKDFIGCYGNNWVRTPTFDHLAERGIVFEDAICNFPKTTPSHSSILTSLYPTSHGVRGNGRPLNTGHTTLAEVLLAAGYCTAAFVSNASLERNVLLDQGFQTYDDAFPDRELNRDLPERVGDKAVAAALKWLRDNYSKNFFLWVHLNDPHGAYTPPKEYRYPPRPAVPKIQLRLGQVNYPGAGIIPKYQIIDGRTEKEFYVARYAGEVSFADHCIGQLIEELYRLGCSDNTLIVFASDHGESLGEHGRYFQHGFSLFRPELDIPLIFVCPDLKVTNKRISGTVQSIDIMPTVLDLLGIPIDFSIQGSSLVPLFTDRGGEYPKIGFAETEVGYCIVDRGYKLIVNAQFADEELYKTADLDEKNDIAKDHPQLVAELKAKLVDLEQRSKKRSLSTEEHRLDRETVEKLKALGYLD